MGNLVLGVVFLALAARGEASDLERLRRSYEDFYTARYSLEQQFPFRLVSIRDHLQEYLPHTNILAPIVSFGPQQLLADMAMEGSLLNAFMPILFGVTSGNIEQIDALGIAEQFAGRAFAGLTTAYKSFVGNRRISYRLFLAPYRKTDAELYYDFQKISMVRSGQVELRQESVADVRKHITKEINLRRAFLYYNHNPKKTTPSLLAARLHFTADDRDAILTSDVLLNLYPRDLPWEKDKDPVSFSRLIVPEGKGFRFPVALISIKTFLNRQSSVMTISFGNFTEIDDNYRFVVTDRSDLAFNPWLAGRLQKFKPLNLKFWFQKIVLSLTDLHARKVQMVFSPGFKINSLLAADFGKFRMKKIDRKFRTSINAELAEVKDRVGDVDKLLNEPRVTGFVRDNVIAGLRKILSPQKKVED